MRVLITGANGLLGQKLVNLYSDNDAVELIATAKGPDRNPEGTHTYIEMDITNEDEVLRVIQSNKPDVIINTAAMTHVDQCELNPEACRLLNVTAVEYLVRAAKKTNSHFIHLSTDFVFDGLAGPYSEEDEPNPLSIYAESKLESEKLVEESGLKYAIARTMLVYGIVPDMSRSNIILWVKKSLEEGK